MKLCSIQVALPKTVMHNGREVQTGIFKEPVDGPVRVGQLGLQGDGQADLKVHGGRYKAVYAYPTEHLGYWQQLVPQHTYGYGAFGENLCTEGLLETNVSIGDLYQIGTAILKVTQPRFPCFKLGLKFGDPLMVKHFHESMRSGIYFEVLKEGEIENGDQITVLEQSGGATIYQFLQAKNTSPVDPGLIKRLLKDPNLLPEWSQYFQNKLKE